MTQLIQLDKAELKDAIREVVMEAMADFQDSAKSLQNEPGEPPMIYGIKGLAEFLGVSVPTAQKLKNNKTFPCYQRGRVVVFKTAEVLRAMQRTNKY